MTAPATYVLPQERLAGCHVACAKVRTGLGQQTCQICHHLLRSVVQITRTALLPYGFGVQRHNGGAGHTHVVVMAETQKGQGHCTRSALVVGEDNPNVLYLFLIHVVTTTRGPVIQ